MKKSFLPGLLALCLLTAPLVGMAQTIAPQSMLSAQAQDERPLKFSATLYFRYRNTGYLARETRELSVARTVPDEMALVSALLEGPGSLSPQLSPLFPAGTQVLSTAVDGETLFITFNEALLGRYSDEAVVFSAGYSQGEGALRRRLAMASLANTLTESGLYSRIQVLVRQEKIVSNSMRLSNRYYLLDDDTLPPPLSRQEEYVLTPRASAEVFFSGWQSGDFTSGLRLVKGSEARVPAAIPSDYDLKTALEQAPKLAEFLVTPGTLSLDGQTAVVTVSLRLLSPDGSERLVERRPLRLMLREGVYTIPYESFARLMEAVK